MIEDAEANPAEAAAKAALSQVFGCIDERKSFRLEAGAGAGKTYTLIKALRRVIETDGSDLLRRGGQVACITFTNVAKDEIEARTDRHPSVRSDTIHGFAWSLLKDFQVELRRLVAQIDPQRAAELAELGGVGSRRIEYDLGFWRIRDDAITLRHDDIPALLVQCLDNAKFRRLLVTRYPVLFIDEYQDTNAAFVEAIKAHFLGQANAPLIGFFGDHWQKIYGNGCGKVEHDALTPIDKEANFRSVKAVVDVLNKMRPALPQMVRDPDAPGEARVFHTNSWQGQRRTGAHWNGDTSPEASRRYLQVLRERLEGEGWDFGADKTKILMLTHNGLAAEQGYPSIPPIFSNNDAFIKKEDPHIAFLADQLEPAVAAYQQRRFGEMLEAFASGAPRITSRKDKIAWTEIMDRLLALRDAGTIGDVIDAVRASELLQLPDAAEEREAALAAAGPEPVEGESSSVARLRKLRAVPYGELIALDRFIDGHTPFQTKHGVKGLEFENVLVVIGRGWNHYNFEQMLAWSGPNAGPPPDKLEFYERNRNLFYVSCSRPQRRLAVLFTQQLGAGALTTLGAWFGADNLIALPGDV
ncbi:MAG TPA: UvrD-helicase domain-containing protein [Caulobacteraceae bacterium]|nr:UvrD-helicase domain-containing protein [Caulobacteraceae bacterium]